MTRNPKTIAMGVKSKEQGLLPAQIYNPCRVQKITNEPTCWRGFVIRARYIKITNEPGGTSRSKRNA